MSSTASRQSCVIFDLDGVLIDSRLMVQQAYEKVGVTMPSEAWGHPWHEWLPNIVGFKDAARIHREKTMTYMAMVRKDDIPTLPPFEVMRQTRKNGLGDVAVLTGASRTSTEFILTKLGMAPEQSRIWCRQDVCDKSTVIQSVSQSHNVKYIDDDVNALAEIVKMTDGLDAFLYRGQGVDEVGEWAWTL